MTEVSHAVFLSYASQDAEAAQKICEALRAAGIEVWFDQSELRGGDAWDTSIRKQIKTCALFIPVISHTTHDRVEGYFRLEWKLAVDRSHLISADQAFLLPVVIDDTRDDDERVPERFREVQWTRLPGGVTPAAFVERVRRLLHWGAVTATPGSVPAARAASCAGGPKARPCPLAVEGSAARGDRRGRRCTRFRRGEPTYCRRSVAQRLRGAAPGTEQSRDRLQSAFALHRGAAVRELKRR